MIPQIEELTVGASIFALISTLGFTLIGFAVFCLVSAACLQRGVAWLGFEPISFKQSFLTSVLVNIVVGSLNTLIAFYFTFSTGMLEDNEMVMRNLAFSFSPVYYLEQTLLNLLVATGIFSCVIMRSDNDKPSGNRRANFAEAFGIAAVYFGLSAFIVLMLSAVVGILVALFFAIT